MRLRCLRDLVERCPHIERINVGWVRGPDDEDAYYDYYDDPDDFKARLFVTALLDLIPNLKELDFDFVMVLGRFATLRSVRFNSSILFSPYKYVDAETRFHGPHDFVADLAERTHQDLNWIHSRKFVAALPKMIKMPLSKLTFRFFDGFGDDTDTIAILDHPSFAVVHTALELCIHNTVDVYAAGILRLGFANLRSLDIGADEDMYEWCDYPNTLMETFGGRFEKLQKLSITSANGESEQYTAFWGAMKAGTLPPPPVNLEKV
ncbi:hypothetical protein HK102_003105 [Quaeritorhiza haematococci]|nr:hypothetical protein HK102_003105 [Quaeritorhiza haematococci]